LLPIFLYNILYKILFTTNFVKNTYEFYNFVRNNYLWRNCLSIKILIKNNKKQNFFLSLYENHNTFSFSLTFPRNLSNPHVWYPCLMFQQNTNFMTGVSLLSLMFWHLSHNALLYYSSLLLLHLFPPLFSTRNIHQKYPPIQNYLHL